MSKFASFAEYPKRSLAGAEAALLTAWASLSRYHNNLVLVGGLAVKYPTFFVSDSATSLHYRE